MFRTATKSRLAHYLSNDKSTDMSKIWKYIIPKTSLDPIDTDLNSNAPSWMPGPINTDLNSNAPSWMPGPIDTDLNSNASVWTPRRAPWS